MKNLNTDRKLKESEESAHRTPVIAEEESSNSLLLSWRQFLETWRAERTGPISGSLGNSAVLSAVLAAAYLALGQLSISATAANWGTSFHLFLAEGFALAFAILFGPRVALGVFFGQLALAHLSGLPLAAGVLIGVVNSVEVALGGWLCWRLRLAPHLKSPREMALFIAVCCLILQPLSATGGILAHSLFAGPLDGGLTLSWLLWWVVNALGQLLCVPLILSWLQRPWKKRDSADLRQAFLISGLYLVPLGLYLWVDLSEYSQYYRLFLFVTFYLPLLAIAVRARMRTLSLLALLLTGSFICIVKAGPSLEDPVELASRYVLANFVILLAVVSALMMSALRSQVIARNRQLRDAIQARERILAVVGHDLRGPFGTLKSYLDLMAEGDLSRQDFHEVQHILQKGVNDANATLANLLEWADSQGSSQQPKSQNVEVRAAASEAAELLSLTAEKKGVEIRNEVPQNAVVWANGHQLQSVFRNLLANAIKFTRPGGSITVSAELKDGHWSVAIRDTGIGMKRERAARLFEIRNEYRSTLGTENERGLGLGLQICREFVQANAGTIEATGQPGEGTTIHVRLRQGKSEAGT